MSKVFEALEDSSGHAGWLEARSMRTAAWPPVARAEAPARSALSQLNMEGEMVRLHQQLEALLPDRDHRAVQFMGSCEGEGTSTVVSQFARVSASRFGQRVLLLEISPYPRGHRVAMMRRDRALAGVVPARAGDTTFDVAQFPQELLAAPDTSDSRGPAEAWAKLRQAYDLVLVDSPPATTSPEGLAASNQVDGVILVLAAEETRWPVAQSVKESIERSGGRVLGIVLNKRQYYIPEFIYRRL